MHLSTAILALVVGIVQGQESVTSATASASSTATTSTNAPVTHTVDVAKGGHSYSPDVVLAAVGDTIQFNFYPQNHSVIRAAYEQPCVPYEMIEGVGYTGFFSGFHPVDAVLDEPPTWSLLINDTDPIFYYCGAPNSCIGYQMVGVINPSANTSLSRQKQLAAESTFMLLPGEDWPSEGSVPSGVTYTPTAAASSTGATTVTATPTAASGSSHSVLSGGAIAGIAVAAAVVLVAAGVAVWYCGRQSRARAAQQPMAPAQEVYPGSYQPPMGQMASKPGHMSQMSGYTMPPGYENQPFVAQGMRSPTMQTVGTPVDPMMIHPSASPPPHMMMHSGATSPAPAPAYGQAHVASMYAPGTHHVPPVEMDSAGGETGRTSVEKQGVERYQ